ncbi:MAG: tetratricopeptide repeat protein, partial [Planctomycetota bacterium]
MSFYTELKRRHVFKVAIVYSAVAWLLLQVSDTLGPALHLPEWFVSAVAFLLILGFPVAIIFAWAFDLTPEGLKRETKAEPAAPVAGKAGNKLNYIVVTALVLALSYFVFDKVILDSGRDTAGTSTAVQVAQQQPAEIESAKTDNSIAVLPFVNMSSDEEQEYFSDGLSEELLNLLARIPELKVAARTSSFSFKDK